jgi:hypothetical protein
MKCPRCYALNSSSDTNCFGCGVSLEAALLARQPTPQWAYLFAIACGIIPVVALGGLIPIILGIGGASSCLGLARAHSVPAVLRVFGCVAITAGAWFLFLLLFAAVVAAYQH